MPNDPRGPFLSPFSIFTIIIIIRIPSHTNITTTTTITITINLDRFCPTTQANPPASLLISRCPRVSSPPLIYLPLSLLRQALLLLAPCSQQHHHQYHRRQQLAKRTGRSGYLLVVYRVPEVLFLLSLPWLQVETSQHSCATRGLSARKGVTLINSSSV